MKYKRHFLAIFLIFLAILAVSFFVSNQPFPGTSYGYGYVPYFKPVTVDVCNQMVVGSWSGGYSSQGCNQVVNHDANYYYYGTVNSGTGQYVPYFK